jgi:hypothetical protein
LSAPYFTNCLSASDSATKAPVMDAVRVPPSACSTSQSSTTVRSPSACMSTTERRARPISRWISCVRPEARPLLTSRGVRLEVARGSIEYSAVTQPFPELRRKGGTLSSMVAAHNTCVLPTLMSAEPSAVIRGPITISTGRMSASRRLSVRIIVASQK